MDHLPAQQRFGRERGASGTPHAVGAAAYARLGQPFLGQIEPPIKQRIALPTGIAQKDAGLTVRPLPQFAAILTFHTHRLLALLGKITAVQDQHPVIVTHIGIDFLPVAVQDRRVIPGAFTHELLHRAYRMGLSALQAQHHRLNRFARDIEQQAVQILCRPLPLFAALKQGAVNGVIRPQFLQRGRSRSCGVKSMHRRRLDRRVHPVLLLCRGLRTGMIP